MIKWNNLDWNKNRLDQINNESILNRPFGCGRFRFSFRVSFRTLILNKLWCVFCSCTKPTRDRSWCLTVWYQRTFANSFWICRVYKNLCWIKQSFRRKVSDLYWIVKLKTALCEIKIWHSVVAFVSNLFWWVWF